MLNELDFIAEDTSVEQLLRKVKIRMLYRNKAPMECDMDAFFKNTFVNVDLGSDVFFYADYAARIYDPRTVPSNTRFYGLKKLIMRVMRIYSTPQVEFNAAIARIVNLFLDKFQNIVNLFNYFREAEVKLQSRLEDSEGRQADLETFLMKNRDRIEKIEKQENRFNNHRDRIEKLESQEQELYRQRLRIERAEKTEREVVNNHRIRIEDIEDRERTISTRVANIEDLKERLQIALSENSALRKRLDSIVLNLQSGKTPVSGTVQPAPQSLPAAQSAFLNDHLYFPIFNDDRGIEEIIHSRIKQYIPFFRSQKYLASVANPFVVDIGCGRGEFLEECITAGIPCKGVDINEDMIAHCKEKHLDVVKDDAIQYLATLENDSLRGIITCHVVEHFPTQSLLTFLRLCAQKLAPGGRLVIETPNPCSFFSLSMFYRDFTHQQPIHPDMLKLALEKLGMINVKITKLYPAPRDLCLKNVDDPIMNENINKLNDLIFGYLDYSASAEKP